MILCRVETCTNHREVYRRVRVYTVSRGIELGRWSAEMPERSLRREIREQLIRSGDIGARERICWDIY